MVQALIRQSACVADLKARAKRRIPGFVFDYVEGGCNQEHSLRHNRAALDAVYLRPDSLKPYTPPTLTTTVFEQTYQAPFGIAPLGLSGLVWPDASLFHARAAHEAKIPFVLSTLSTVAIEEAAAAAKEHFWFQLYPPSDLEIRKDLMRRAQAVGCKHLVVTIDVPVAGRRPKDMRSGLAIPPKITPKSVFQSVLHPSWSIATLRAGLPQFASLQPYIQNLSNIEDIANYVRTTLKDVVDEPMLKQIREQWSGKLIVKGIITVEDARRAVACGADGVIVSNHGGRQLDAARSSVECLREIVEAVPEHIVVMADSGVESGVDIARFLANGAQMVFSGRSFLYGVAAHGEPGAAHTIDLLKEELQQVLGQLHCDTPADLVQHLVAQA